MGVFETIWKNSWESEKFWHSNDNFSLSHDIMRTWEKQLIGIIVYFYWNDTMSRWLDDTDIANIINNWESIWHQGGSIQPTLKCQKTLTAGTGYKIVVVVLVVWHISNMKWWCYRNSLSILRGFFCSI